MKKLALAALVLSANMMACTTQVGTPEDAAGTASDELQISVSDTLATGSFGQGADKLEFKAVAQADDVFEVTVTVHDMTLDATIDAKNNTASYDGFAAQNGDDTQVLEADRQVVLSFYKALDGKLGSQPAKAADMLRRAASVWSETSPTVNLDRRVMGDQGRGWTLLCGQLGTIYRATHDCWDYDNGDSRSSVYPYIGDYGTSNTYYWHSSWTTAAYDHASLPYEYGDCYARCGADCGSGHVYSVDCNNHDSCVRNGHSIASLWCDDEFTSTTDDFTFAPNCY